MSEPDPKYQLNAIKGYCTAIDAIADQMLSDLEEGGEPVPPDPDPNPPTMQHIYMDPIWGGPIGAKGRRVVEGDKCEWKGKAPQFQENTDYVNPKLWNCKLDSGESLIGQNIPTGVRLFNPIFEDITGGDHFWYINHGHSEEKNTLGLVIFGGVSKGVKTKATWAEFKATRILIEDHVVDQSCSSAQYIRQRHGRQLVMSGGRAQNEIAARGWCHWVDVPGAVGQSWGGPLPYKSKDWMKMHTGTEGDWAGKAFQGTLLMYFGPRLKKALVGVPSGNQKSTYPALDNILHAAIKDVELKDEKNTTKGEMTWRELWKKAGLL